MIHCSNCHTLYPDQEIVYRCQVCGGTFDYQTFPQFYLEKIENDLEGIWQYRHSFGLPEEAPILSLGEGKTPLIQIEAFGKQVSLKLEYLNPSGSHKDRGVALMVSLLSAFGVREAVEDSSGNAGASFAAYAGSAGLKARVFVPDYASGPKQAQIAAYGAQVVRILGRRSDVAKAVRRVVDQGAVYASHAYLPHLLPGYATIAYELVEQIGSAPGAVIAPVGHGSLLLGVGRGFENLKSAGVIKHLPKLVGVQAMACAPLWAVFSAGAAGLGWVTERDTLAEGVRVLRPIRGDSLLRLIESSNGFFVAVEEDHILPARDQLAHKGFFVEPTSAIVWDALSQVVTEVPQPIVLLLTGAGLKSNLN